MTSDSVDFVFDTRLEYIMKMIELYLSDKHVIFGETNINYKVDCAALIGEMWILTNDNDDLEFDRVLYYEVDWAISFGDTWLLTSDSVDVEFDR